MATDQAPNASTFDATTPHRPGLADVNGAVKQNEASPELPPDPATMPTAPEYNTICRTLIALGATPAQWTVSVKQVAGAYSVDLMGQMTSTTLVLGTHYAIDKNGVGDVSVHILQSLLAQGPGNQAFRPKVTLNEDINAFARAIEFTGTIGGFASRGARVKVLTVPQAGGASAAVEGGFTVDIG